MRNSQNWRVAGAPQLAMFLGLSVVFSCSFALAEDWPRFRGPNGKGTADSDTPLPVTWSPSEGVKWKVDLPGRGVSSPIIIGNRVFVTAYSGYGMSRENPGSMDDLTRHLVCLDAQTGKKIWLQDLPAEVPEDPYSGAGVPEHGYASHTPVSDGESIFMFCGKSGLYAFDLDGKQLWKVSLGTDSDQRRWGSSSSPIVVEDVVVVAAGPEARAIIGLDKKTGKELWRAEANSLGNVWGTPIVAPGKDGQTDIVIGAPYEVWGINAETGKLAWYCEAIPEDSYSSSIVLAEDKLFGISGRQGGSIAIKPGGYGNVTESHVIWTGRDRNRYGTPVVKDNRLYYVSSGIATCLNATTGEEIFRGRLGTAEPATEAPAPRGGFGGFGRGRGGNYSSAVIGGEHLYFVAESGVTHVLKLGDEFNEVATNTVTEERELFNATPAISNGCLFLRSDHRIYCVSNDSGK